MGHYRSNVRDLEFNLFELFGADQPLGRGPFTQMDPQTARGVLVEINRLATGPLADSFADADRHPPVFDSATGSIALPESFKASYRALLAGEWFRLDLPEHLGGFGASPSLRWAAAELILGANPAAYMYQSGPGFAAILERLGTPDQKSLARTMIERQWGATMVLTEPDAGSDVGAGRTRAFPQPDGSWHLEGVKRFITSADWDVPGNIVHLVLARPEGVAGAGGPGTKGLSLFVVPKFLVDSGGRLGERNGAYVTNVEKKMGLKASATCEITFGDKHPAIGTLVGDVHNGIAQMFQVIEYARMMVGTKAISTLSTGYLNALEFAKTRVQGADLTQLTDKTAPRVTITHHPDVRRMLMLQKAYVEGMRSLVMFASSYQDQVELAAHTGERAEAAEQINDLLLPIVKGFGSERSYELLAVSLQTLGGSGYLQDYPIEQYIRDAKIDTLYEGTTSIQGQDLFFRKIVRNKGAALTAILTQIEQFATSEAGNGQLKTERAALSTALADVQVMLEAMVGDLSSAAEHAPNLYKVGLNTTRLLMSLGDLIVGWLLQRSAVIAMDNLAAGVGERDQAFYEGKVAAARFFAQSVLPELSARSRVVQTTTLDLMDLPEAAF